MPAVGSQRQVSAVFNKSQRLRIRQALQRKEAWHRNPDLFQGLSRQLFRQRKTAGNRSHRGFRCRPLWEFSSATPQCEQRRIASENASKGADSLRV